MAELTPMKKQYREIKEKHADCLLFFRLGDFYEMFEEDAHIAARELDLALTTRDRGKPEEDQTPMCGVPYHSAEAYISRLIAKGYKVAVCEQTEDPLLAKGLVRRDVIRVISPGTVIESSMLEDGVSNYLAAVFLSAGAGSAAFCDVSTGEVCLASFPAPAAEHLQNELARFRPREVLLSAGAAEDETLREFLEKKLECRTELDEARFDFLEGGRGSAVNTGSPRLKSWAWGRTPPPYAPSAGFYPTLRTRKRANCASSGGRTCLRATGIWNWTTRRGETWN